MHATTVQFLQDLAIVMIVAGLVTIVFHRLRQPVVLGYIIAGVIIGPNTPPFPLISNEHHSIDTLAEIGVIFLMFSLGLHFSLRKLMQVGATAFIAATLEIVLMLVIGYELGRLFGWTVIDSIFLGAILSISSTTIIVKALAELKLTKQRFAQLIFGILIVEDIIAIAMLAMLSGISADASLDVGSLFRVVGELTIFLTSVLVVGLLAVPVLLRYVARFKSDEMLLVAALGLCFGISLLAVKLEYSVALGAFLIGAIIAEAREAGRIEQLIEPLRDMFSAVFFVAIGMLIDPALLVRHWIPIVVITVAVVVGKVLTCTTGAFLAGNDTRTSLRVGMGLAQIGEFSFIIAQLGLSRKLTSEFIYPIAVSVSAITTLLTPYLIKSSDRVVTVFDRLAPNAILAYLETYQRWIADMQASSRHKSQLRRLMRKWALQIALNVALITAMLIIAKWLATRVQSDLPALPEWTGGAKTLIWLSAMLATLPLLVATLRKMRAVAAVLAEASTQMRVSAASGLADNTHALRAVIANAIFIPAALAVGVWILAVSAALLPPWPVLVVLLLVIAAVTVMRWNTFVKMYARAQIALRTTLTTIHPEAEAPPVMPMLRDAKMETVSIPLGSQAAGKLIRELQLRTATGASAVGIERDGTSIVNPGPDEELQPEDRILLLGEPSQLAAARELLTKT